MKQYKDGAMVYTDKGQGPRLEFPWFGYKESGIGKVVYQYGTYKITDLKMMQVDLVTQ